MLIKMELNGMARARGYRMQGTENDVAFFCALGCAIVLHCIASPFFGTAGWHVAWRTPKDSVCKYIKRYRAICRRPHPPPRHYASSFAHQNWLFFDISSASALNIFLDFFRFDIIFFCFFV